MEQRKIQKVGHSTLSVSLPKRWIRFAGVKHGDKVYLEEGEDGSLRILSEALVEEELKPKEYSINCDLAREPNLLERLIVGCYMRGVDVVKIFSSTRIDSGQIEEIRNIVRRLVGFSIIEESREKIILQCFIDHLRFEVYPLIKRLSIIVSTMLNEAMEALIQLNIKLANDVIKREDEANNIYWLITRLIVISQRSRILAGKIGLPFGSIGVRLVSKNLERIADCSESIAKIALELHTIRDMINKEELVEISSIEQVTKEVFRKAVNSLLSGDILIANEAINLRTKLEAQIESKMRTTTIPYFRNVALLLAMIAENSASIAAVAINIEISKSNSFPVPAK